jgi:hypothetical protein
MVRSVHIHDFGGPEVLRIEDVETEQPGGGEVRLRIRAIGINEPNHAALGALARKTLPTDENRLGSRGRNRGSWRERDGIFDRGPSRARSGLRRKEKATS